MTGKKKVRESFPTRVVENNVEIFDDEKIADKFNEFYVNVGKTLADGIELSNKSFESYLNENEHEMTEYELTHEE